MEMSDGASESDVEREGSGSAGGDQLGGGGWIDASVDGIAIIPRPHGSMRSK
jgi:hypothetical protein